MNTEYVLAGLVAVVALIVAIAWIVKRNRAVDNAAKRGPELDPDLIRKTRALSTDPYVEIADDIHRRDAMRRHGHPFQQPYGHNVVNPGRPLYPVPKSRPRFPADPVHLTARELERANIRRRLADRKPLSRAGFQAAVASAPQQYRTSDQWLNWFLIYEIVLSEHGSHSTTVSTGITVQPDEPGGGQYGGAGASGGWEGEQRPAPSIADPSFSNAAAFAAGAALAGSDPGPAPSEPSRPDPSPAPSYSAPNPSPSYSSSSDSSSSSSSSSDSGSSGGGGDSGGGGGGGGD